MLSGPKKQEILPSSTQNKVLACLATRFNIKKNIVQSVVKLDQPLTQYGKVTRLEGGDLMIACDLVKETEDSQDASFVRVEICLFFIHAASDHSFSSILNLWIDMPTKCEESQNLSHEISLAN